MTGKGEIMGAPKLEFADVFFEDEVIDGFYVPGIVKRVWAQQLEILEDIKTVCRECGIRVSAAYGTLLGALRHGGFIPWDDDIDLWAEREDYMRFLKYAKKVLPDNYDVLSVYSEKKKCEDMMLWVVNSEYANFEPEFLEKYHGSPFRLGVDIFPLDRLPLPDEEEAFLALSDLVTAGIYMADSDEASEEGKKETFSLIEGYCGAKLVYDDTLKQQLIQLKDIVHSNFASKTSNQVSDVMYWKKHRDVRLEKDWIHEVKDAVFAGTTIPIPAKPEKVLEILYGDWKRYVQGGADHEYPIIAEQLRMIESLHGITYGTYHPVNVTKSRSVPYEKRGKWLFIPFSGAHWRTMLPVYSDAKGFASDIRVMPIPYYIKKLETPQWHTSDQSEVVETAMQEEGENNSLVTKIENMEYPRSLQIEKYECFDIDAFSPDVIVIQCPYDTMGATLMVHPMYHAAELRKHCKCLIYVPFFELPDFKEEDICSVLNAKYYAVTPAVMLSDIVLLPTQRMREIYLTAAKEYVSEAELKKLSEKIICRDAEEIDATEIKYPGKPDTETNSL